MKRTLFSSLAVALLLSNVDAAAAAIIDFETTPGGVSPTNDAPLPVGSPYVFPGLTVSFGFDLDGNGSVESDAVFEHTGVDAGEPPNGGFEGFGLVADTPDPLDAAQLGNWFLRSPLPGQPIGRFVIQYASSSPVTAASGEIWDIDGTQAGFTEQYLVEALDASNLLLASQLSPVGTLPSSTAPLNGRPWVFGFSGLSAGIDHIVETFVGTKMQGIGLAFNNFNPLAIPEPGAAVLCGLASIAALAVRRRPLRIVRD